MSMSPLRFFLTLAISVSTSLAAVGCNAPLDEEEEGGLESELSVNEVVQAGTQLRVTASSLNVRGSGSTSAPIVGSVPNGATVTAVTTSGQNGWVNIRTASNTVGWVFGKYVARVSGGTTQADTPVASTTTPSGASCSSSRGNGIVGRYQKALHDSLAHAEGTRGRGQDGYNVIFGGTTVSSCSAHPNRCIRYGSTCSTASGRYQFLRGTWNNVASARSLRSFEPENQERAALYLVHNVRRVTVPENRAMTATEFTNAMNKLSWEWASLPPGRYGQPRKSAAEMRRVYCAAAGCT